MLKEDQSLNLTFQIDITNISYNDLSHGEKKKRKKKKEEKKKKLTDFLKRNCSSKRVKQDKV